MANPGSASRWARLAGFELAAVPLRFSVAGLLRLVKRSRALLRSNSARDSQVRRRMTSPGLAGLSSVRPLSLIAFFGGHALKNLPHFLEFGSEFGFSESLRRRRMR